MKLDLIAEIWNMTKDSLMANDRDAIAENLIGILIDHDFSPTDIKSVFRDDYDITSALKAYVDDTIEFEEEPEYEEYEDDSDDYNDDEWE